MSVSRDRETLVASELDGYEPAVGAALWRLQDGRVRTLRVLHDLPSEFVDKQTRGNSIGTILYHLALIETDWLCTEILQEPYPDELKSLLPAADRDREGVLTAVRGQSMDEHLTRLSAVRATVLSRLRGMTTEDFNRVRTFSDYAVSPAWVLHHLAQHEAEHRGELGSVIDGLKTGDG
jgi:uncharacterized damage-inducible protein DinB